MNENNTACAVVSQSETASQWQQSFICANDDLHHALLGSPLAVFVYVFGISSMVYSMVRRSV